jgi:hypothetical protein
MAPSPQVITVTEVPVNPTNEGIRLRVTTSARDTPLLQANRESRQVSLSTLVPIFPHIDAKNSNSVYFDYSKDALYIKQPITLHTSTPFVSVNRLSNTK